MENKITGVVDQLIKSTEDIREELEKWNKSKKRISKLEKKIKLLKNK